MLCLLFCGAHTFSFSQNFTVYKTKEVNNFDIIKLQPEDACKEINTNITRNESFWLEYHYNSNGDVELFEDSHSLFTDEDLSIGPKAKTRLIFGSFDYLFRSFALDYQGNHYLGTDYGQLIYFPHKYHRDSMHREISRINGRSWVALTLVQNKLYGISIPYHHPPDFDSVYLYEILLDQPDSLRLIMPLNFDSSLLIPYQSIDYSLNQHFYACDSISLYLTLSIGYDTRKASSVVYRINVEDKTQRFICRKSILEGEYSFTSLAHETEFMSTRCVLALDLDEDGSSGDYTNGNFIRSPCPTDSIPLHDADLYIHSIHPIDSLHLEFYLPPIDSDQEILLCNSKDPQFRILRPDPQHISIYNLGNASTMDWKALIQDLRYHNLLPVPTEGIRELRIKMYSLGKMVDALISISLPTLPIAGSYGDYFTCTSDAPFDPFIVITAPKSRGGRWLEPFHDSIATLFTPGIDPPGIYTYVLDRPQCYGDTVQISISYYPTPALNLGPDTSLCHTSEFVIDPQLLDLVPTWQDGKKKFSYLAKSSGWYWAEIKDSNWCVARDSVFLDFRNEPILSHSVRKLCPNKKFLYKNIEYSSGQTILDTLFRYPHCDSVISIELQYDEPIRLHDTLLLCLGSQLLYRDLLLVPDSSYFFTLPHSAYGCDTVLSLTTLGKPNVQQQFEYTICPDSSLFFDGKLLTANKTYQLKKNGFGTDCDTLVSVKVNAFPQHKLSIGGVYSGYLNDEIILQLYSNTLRSYSINPQDDQITSLLNDQIKIKFLHSNDYSIQALDENGCGLISSFRVHLIEQAAVFAPNVFTPNKDGINDNWTPVSTPNVTIKSCSIYSNWEQLVYFSTSPHPTWDGSLRGKEMNPNVFVYVILYQDQKGNMKKAVGDITLIR